MFCKRTVVMCFFLLFILVFLFVFKEYNKYLQKKNKGTFGNQEHEFFMKISQASKDLDVDWLSPSFTS